jgi:hypothetical protein
VTVLLSILCYLVVGVITARLFWLYVMECDSDDSLMPFLAVVAWPILAALLAVFGVVEGLTRLVTWPTREQRRQRRMEAAERERDQVRREARRLGLPLVEDLDVTR